MAPSNIGYSLRECGHHFRRNWTTVLGAVVTIFLSLFIIGLFVLGSVMINNMVGSVEDTVTIQAFLSDDADQSAVTAFQTKVQGWDNVESVIYKDKDQALEYCGQFQSDITIPHRTAKAFREMGFGDIRVMPNELRDDRSEIDIA